MADGQRLYPVNKLVLHHSAGPDFANADHAVIQQWFNDVGRNRGYAGLAHSGHYLNGSEIFTQAQYAAHYHAGASRTGYCLVPLMDDPYNNVAWHAGNWLMNQHSIGIENCGTYLDHELTDEALFELMEFWRPQDQALSGATEVWVHKWIFGTACPGLIAEQVPKAVDMLNDPTKWEALLFPPPTTTTTTTTMTTTTTTTESTTTDTTTTLPSTPEEPVEPSPEPNDDKEPTMKAFLEALKEFARLAVFAAISAGIAYFGNLDTTWAVVITAAFRTLDKYVHENPNIPFKGILPF